jgi:predicted GIY-YIG superfamily endonuclease
MQESKERAMQFEKELKALLKKWNTEIEMEVCNLPTDGKKCYSKRCPM